MLTGKKQLIALFIVAICFPFLCCIDVSDFVTQDEYTGDITNIQNNITNLNITIVNVSNNFTVMNNTFTNIVEQFTELNNTINDLNVTIEEFGDLNDTIYAMNETINDISDLYNSLLNDYNELVANFTDYVELLESFGNITALIADINSDIDNLEIDVAYCQANITSLDSRLDSAETTISTLNTKVTNLYVVSGLTSSNVVYSPAIFEVQSSVDGVRATADGTVVFVTSDGWTNFRVALQFNLAKQFYCKQLIFYLFDADANDYINDISVFGWRVDGTRDSIYSSATNYNSVGATTITINSLLNVNTISIVVAFNVDVTTDSELEIGFCVVSGYWNV